MNPDDRAASATEEQMKLLDQLVRQARAKGVRTGVRDDELQDLDQEQAAELIDQLQRRLGHTRG
jgi:hypothetical protein